MSDRPSPRGGGPRELAVARAMALIAMAERGDVTEITAMAEWIGRATAIMRELTRDA